MAIDFVLALLKVEVQSLEQIFTHALQVLIMMICICDPNEPKIPLTPKLIKFLSGFDPHIADTEDGHLLDITLQVPRVKIPFLLSKEQSHGGGWPMINVV